MRILFWNVHRKDIRRLVCDVASQSHADVVSLVENGVDSEATLQALREGVCPTFCLPKAVTPSRFQIFARGPELDLAERYSGNRVTLRRLNLNGAQVLFGVVHVVDKLNWDDPHQAFEVQRLSEEIRKAEEECHRRTIVVGDFNMNPYDVAMNAAQGMNAMMTQKCVERGARKVQDVDYPFFYNPMWGLLGDRTAGPAGTYYHSSGSRGMYGWNMIDQVLIRPDAIGYFDDVQIIAKAGQRPLHSEGMRPDKANASDHFPLLIKLNRDKP